MKKALLLEEQPPQNNDTTHVMFLLKEIELDEQNTLKDMQTAVKGLIELTPFNNTLINSGIDIYCNEEGKILNMTPSIRVKTRNETIDIIHGNVLFAGVDKNGNTVSLTDTQIDLIKKELTPIRIFTYDKKIINGYSLEHNEPKKSPKLPKKQ